MFTSRRHFLAYFAASVGSTIPIGGLAEGLETPRIDMVRLLSGYPPGGTTDTIARRVAERLRTNYAKNIVVDTKTGAAGQIAVQALKSAPADGSVILVTPMASLAIYPYTYKHLPYDPVADLAPVSLACTFSSALAVGPAVPTTVRNVSDFITWCKANPASSNCASPSAGTPQHFIVELLSKHTGTDIKHVPYRGSQPAILDLIGGQVSAVAAPVGEFLQHLPRGNIRMLATSSDARNRFVPQVPTFAEQGFKGFVFNEWFGFFLPAKTPADVVAKLSAALKSVLAAPDVVDGLAAIGLEVRSSTPTELSATLRADLNHWGPLVKATGFTADS